MYSINYIDAVIARLPCKVIVASRCRAWQDLPRHFTGGGSVLTTPAPLFFWAVQRARFTASLGLGQITIRFSPEDLVGGLIGFTRLGLLRLVQLLGNAHQMLATD